MIWPGIPVEGKFFILKKYLLKHKKCKKCRQGTNVVWCYLEGQKRLPEPFHEHFCAIKIKYRSKRESKRSHDKLCGEGA